MEKVLVPVREKRRRIHGSGVSVRDILADGTRRARRWRAPKWRRSATLSGSDEQADLASHAGDASASPVGDVPLRLDVFEGPLDILLHLVREQKLDINDIPSRRSPSSTWPTST